MSDDIAPGALLQIRQREQPSKDEIISLARKAIEMSRLGSDMQQPGVGVTVDLGHKQITNLPEEVIDIIKDEIERWVSAMTVVAEVLTTVDWQFLTIRSRRFQQGWLVARG